MTPLLSDRGFTVLVNRGFVPPERVDPRTRGPGQRSGPSLITGLLRLSEPGGGFLRRNDPVHDRWYSRDVAAIARARGLRPGATAPYFIDADATPNPGGLPVGGLTVISFPNSHLVYALTWFGLALTVAIGFAYAAREEWRIRRQAKAR
jgi:surfeit locus 1 family protein